MPVTAAPLIRGRVSRPCAQRQNQSEPRQKNTMIAQPNRLRKILPPDRVYALCLVALKRRILCDIPLPAKTSAQTCLAARNQSPSTPVNQGTSCPHHRSARGGAGVSERADVGLWRTLDHQRRALARGREAAVRAQYRTHCHGATGAQTARELEHQSGELWLVSERYRCRRQNRRRHR